MLSLEKIQHDFSKLTNDQKASFMNAIFKRKDLTMEAMRNMGRHQLGTEKITVSGIKHSRPCFITEDFKHYIAFCF